ncbi:MAG: inverse autotransporter beta domain-containing protein [Candidatus Omnitrophica bacterium]|nr:inverse autotransporter beta domain-containing protein [Candidatus Omnitrophota bacterium]
MPIMRLYLAVALLMGVVAPAAAAELPDYMRDWEFGFHAEDDTAFRGFADLIFPLYRPADRTSAVFLEPRVSHVDHATLWNFGAGYRRLVRDGAWLVGANTFYDYQAQRHHTRLGIGVEALSAYAELRANGYFGLSPTRIIQEDASTMNVERAVDGYDIEVGVPVPHYSRLKLFGGYEWYDFKKFKNREGWSIRAEYRPVPALVLDLTYSDNTKRDPGVGVNVAFHLPFWDRAAWKAAESPFRLDKAIFPDSDVSERLFTLVERRHEIVVESYSEAVGQITVEIKRGT